MHDRFFFGLRNQTISSPQGSIYQWLTKIIDSDLKHAHFCHTECLSGPCTCLVILEAEYHWSVSFAGLNSMYDMVELDLEMKFNMHIY